MTEERARLRVQLDFSPAAFETLENMRMRTSAESNTEVIRHALYVYEWLVEQARNDRFIEVQENDGKQVSRIEAKWLLK